MTLPMAKNARVAFIGLGVMGYPMAGHLQQNGYQVCVYNRTAEKAERWVKQFSGESAATPKEVVLDADVVFSCVGNDDDLREVMLGEQGVIQQLKPGAVVVDHTTASAEVAQQLADLFAQRECFFMDAPVSGGQQGAERGALTVMCGGAEEVFRGLKPVILSYARAVNLLGPVGSGQKAKMVNQICIAGLLQGLAEGLNFAERVGLDEQQVVDVISQGAAQSWQMDNRHKTMIAGEYNHGFAVDWMRKDLDIVLAEANKQNIALPITELVNDFYRDVQNMGGGRWDTSSLLARLKSQD